MTNSRDTFDTLGLAAWRVLKEVARERRSPKEGRAVTPGPKSEEETLTKSIVRELMAPEPVDAASAANGNGTAQSARMPVK